ncbi:hypothetical protein JNUCC1_00932 [Lentibacillus sp. JNUCC-1]|nr:hypothetical protein [Lentibacillus sp. JNUCC-1]
MLLRLPLPKKVYKFMEPKRLKELQGSKTFFINHLNNYSEEKLGSEIGDNDEGRLNTKFNIGNYTFNKGKPKNPIFEQAFRSMQRGIHIGEEANNVTLENVVIEQNIDDNNYYVYCTSLECDQKLKKEFGGATLVINDFQNFLLSINREMIKIGKQPYSFGACEYVSKRENVFTEFDSEFVMSLPFLIKEKRYGYQKEFRVLWKNSDNEIIKAPLKLYCPQALEYCEFVF